MTTTIPGLTYVENFISAEEEADLIQFLSQTEDWSTEISRRTIQYGFKYSYKDQAIVARMKSIPDEIQVIVDRINNQFYPESCQINQMIINEYTGRRQGIKKHMDFMDFGPIICSLSLQSSCLMIFYPQEENGAKDRVFMELKPRSLVVMKDEARYDWKHEIPSLKDVIKMKECPQSLKDITDPDTYVRTSLTFRTMKDSFHFDSNNAQQPDT